jgi:membrane associated rhomboid family serine protease
MTWRDRPYSSGPEMYNAGPRSWLGGMPAPGRAVKAILIANVAVFVLCLFTGGEGSFLYRLMLMRSDLVAHGQVWRLFTFTYLHDQGSLGHLFFNMLGLYFLGMYLERHLGPRRFFAFYTIGGFVAVALYLLVTLAGWLDPRIALVGASGGVLAVLGACAVLFPGIQLILILFPVPIRTAALIFGVFYAFNLFSRGINAGGDACHLAGLAFGIAWGYRGHRWLGWWEDWHDRRRERRRQAGYERQQATQEAVDRILEKVHRGGLASLSRAERRTLEAASRRERG